MIKLVKNMDDDPYLLYALQSLTEYSRMQRTDHLLELSIYNER